MFVIFRRAPAIASTFPIDSSQQRMSINEIMIINNILQFFVSPAIPPVAGV